MDIASLKKTSSSGRLRNLLLLAQTLILLAAGTTGTQGQASRARVLEINRKERERQLILQPLPAKKDDDSVRLAVLKQIKEDFKNIQGLNNTMMAKAWSREELDYDYISDKVSQIRAKAVRLKTNLSLPEAKDVDKKQPDSVVTGVKEFRAALLLLDASIMSFVTNPLFKEGKVVEVNLAAKASQDLETVVQLTNSIKKAASALNKMSKDSH
jgi:hypothetical protein